ncbi:MAG: phosphoglycerate dehydrogenase, partial [Methanotrichaceae archaeon]|nr:phosphoglycerate dehydrogenase [Methanotrichaceae archaeon]
MKVLVTDALAEDGVKRLESGAEVDVLTNLTPEELVKKIKGYDALVIRSGTKVTAEVINASDKLKVIGRAGVGIDNVDVDAATKKGIIVLNAPGGNTISAAEHTIALIMAMARNIPQANNSLHKGEWNRKKYTGVELYHKTFGIVGLGRVGAEVAARMKAFGMQILAFDPFVTDEKAKQLGIKLASLEQVLKESDFITVHTPLTNDTRNLLDEDEFKMMKPGVRIVNAARGGIINEAALAKAVSEGKVAGAAVDVFTKEPPVGNPLLENDKIITTPHLGASTAEAQVNVALAVADQILIIAEGGMPSTAINMPAISPETLAVMEPYMKLAEKMGSLAGQLAGGRFEGLEMTYGGTVAEKDTRAVTISAIKGLLGSIMGKGAVNFVNAQSLLKERGVRLLESKTETANGYSNAMTLGLRTDGNLLTVEGTVYGNKDQRIIKLNDYRTYVPSEGNIVITEIEDKPNIIGPCCVVLGEEKINIGGMHVGRLAEGRPQLMILSVDQPVTESCLKKIKAIHGVLSTKAVVL